MGARQLVVQEALETRVSPDSRVSWFTPKTISFIFPVLSFGGTLKSTFSLSLAVNAFPVALFLTGVNNFLARPLMMDTKSTLIYLMIY